MQRATRSLTPFMIPVVLVVAILGYLAGHRHVAAASIEATRATTSAGIELKYPTSWRHARATTTIPGLSIAHPLVLVPSDRSAHAGLLSGQFPLGQTSPLPPQLLTLMSGAPNVQVVNLSGGQAYRYSGIGLRGYDGTLDLYVIPNPGESPKVLACYAAKGSSAYLSQCEQIVETFTPEGHTATYDLTPNAAYARSVDGLIVRLNADRLALRRQMTSSASPATVSGLATTLADHFASVVASLSVLEPPLVTGSAQATLAASIVRARDAYRSLATATATPGAVGYDAARAQVESAEAGVDRALEGFALLGYAPRG